jgi:hypothetical protein
MCGTTVKALRQQVMAKMGADSLVEQALLRQFLPPGFNCGKGAVVWLTSASLSPRRSSVKSATSYFGFALSYGPVVQYFREGNYDDPSIDRR